MYIIVYTIYMTTRIIGIKEFRQNIAELWKQAQKQGVRFIVMRHSIPIWDVKPIDEDELILEKYASEIKDAQKQAKKEKTYSSNEVREILGL